MGNGAIRHDCQWFAAVAAMSAWMPALRMAASLRAVPCFDDPTGSSWLVVGASKGFLQNRVCN